MRPLLASLFIIALLSACNTVSPTVDSKADAQEIVDDAHQVVERFKASDQGEAITGLLSAAKGVIIYPSILKAAFFVGGEGGTGVLLGQGEEGVWSSPAFFTFGAASYGLQIGAEESKVVLIITNDETLSRAVEGGLELGANATVAAGSEGLKGSISTDDLQDIYYFAEIERGLFAGINFKGATAVPRDALNAAYYGQPATAKEIIVDRSRTNEQASSLRAALLAP
ncbi:MAG: lipid-binding SYLF domain-containing protein [Alphaproteobacteria bacterium]|nr:lipid-binding SYLF domain-containing protein [Alphaproteobacteria bacterium]